MSERLLKLERRIAELEAQLRRPQIGSMPYVNTRPARAVAGPSTYPGSGNTFYIQFLDGSYTRLTGNQTPIYVNRRAITSTLCHNIRNTLPPENTVLEVFEWKGYWWTDFAEGTEASSTERVEWTMVASSQFVVKVSVPTVNTSWDHAAKIGDISGVSVHAGNGQLTWTELEIPDGTYLFEAYIACKAQDETAKLFDNNSPTSSLANSIKFTLQYESTTAGEWVDISTCFATVWAGYRQSTSMFGLFNTESPPGGTLWGTPNVIRIFAELISDSTGEFSNNGVEFSGLGGIDPGNPYNSFTLEKTA